MNLPTIPANSTPAFTVGWNAAIAAIQAANPTAAPAASIPPVVVPALIDPSADLAAELTAAARGSTLTLTPAATYALTKAAVITAAGVTLNLNGATLVMTGAAAGSTNIAIHGENFTCFGGSISAGDVCFRTYAANTLLHDLTVPDDAIATLLLVDVGGIGATVADSQIGYTSSETVYTMADDTVGRNVNFNGSRGQDCWRSDNDSSGKIPVGFSIEDCTFDQRGNHQNNEAISIRRGTGQIVGCTVQTYIRLGEINTPGALPGANGTVLVSACCFPNTKLGFNLIQIADGVAAVVEVCTFAIDAVQVAISVTPAMSSATLTANTRIRTVAGMTVKPYLYAPQLTPANPLVVETGTLTLDPPAPSLATSN